MIDDKKIQAMLRDLRNMEEADALAALVEQLGRIVALSEFSSDSEYAIASAANAYLMDRRKERSQ